ncbi:MAG: protein translocase subunit SecF, partial [Desulfobacterales bacterium]|nr:protein translocase subunit SecF [Desulfobacterales bacterium]
EETINRSINETLSRTILTSGTTLIVVISLLLFGGNIIKDFAIALTVGIGIGTYSSIYIASPILLAWNTRK